MERLTTLEYKKYNQTMKAFAEARHDAMSLHLKLGEKYNIQKEDQIMPDGRIIRVKKTSVSPEVDSILNNIRHKAIMSGMRQEVEARE